MGSVAGDVARMSLWNVVGQYAHSESSTVPLRFAPNHRDDDDAAALLVPSSLSPICRSRSRSGWPPSHPGDLGKSEVLYSGRLEIWLVVENTLGEYSLERQTFREYTYGFGKLLHATKAGCLRWVGWRAPGLQRPSPLRPGVASGAQ